MIKFMSTNEDTGRKMLGLVISRGNVDNLIKGHPIVFSAEDMGLRSISCNDMTILFFETEEDAKEFFESQGLINEDTVVKVDRSKTTH